jgi:hypothetical protein
MWIHYIEKVVYSFNTPEAFSGLTGISASEYPLERQVVQGLVQIDLRIHIFPIPLEGKTMLVAGKAMLDGLAPDRITNFKWASHSNRGKVD